MSIFYLFNKRAEFYSKYQNWEKNKERRYAVSLFILMLSGIVLWLALRQYLSGFFHYRVTLVLTGVLIFATFMSALSLYADVLIPLLCVMQGVCCCLAAEGILEIWRQERMPLQRELIPLVVEAPVFAVLAWQGIRYSVSFDCRGGRIARAGHLGRLLMLGVISFLYELCLYLYFYF